MKPKNLKHSQVAHFNLMERAVAEKNVPSWNYHRAILNIQDKMKSVLPYEDRKVYYNECFGKK